MTRKASKMTEDKYSKHIEMLCKYAGIPGTPYHSAIMFALEQIQAVREVEALCELHDRKQWCGPDTSEIRAAISRGRL